MLLFGHVVQRHIKQHKNCVKTAIYQIHKKMCVGMGKTSNRAHVGLLFPILIAKLYSMWLQSSNEQSFPGQRQHPGRKKSYGLTQK